MNWMLRPLCWLMGHLPYGNCIIFWSAGGGIPNAETSGKWCVLCDKFWPRTSPPTPDTGSPPTKGTP